MLGAVARAELPVLGVVVERVEAPGEVVAQAHRVAHLVRDDREVELLADPLVQRPGRAGRAPPGSSGRSAPAAGKSLLGLPRQADERVGLGHVARARTCPCTIMRAVHHAAAPLREPRVEPAEAARPWPASWDPPRRAAVGLKPGHLQHVRRDELRLPLRARASSASPLELRVERRPQRLTRGSAPPASPATRGGSVEPAESPLSLAIDLVDRGEARLDLLRGEDRGRVLRGAELAPPAATAACTGRWRSAALVISPLIQRIRSSMDCDAMSSTAVPLVDAPLHLLAGERIVEVGHRRPRPTGAAGPG